MTPSDWLKVQAKDPVIHDLIQRYGTKELHKNRDDDGLEMKQFFAKEVSWLLGMEPCIVIMTLKNLNAPIRTLYN